MKDEIKEILDYLGNNKNYNCDCNNGSYYLELPYREAHELKEYITTLREKYEEADIDRHVLFEQKEKAIEIYENSTSIEYKKKRFMEDKTTADLMYEALQGDAEQ